MKVLYCNLAIITFKCRVKAVPIGEDFYQSVLIHKKKKEKVAISFLITCAESPVAWSGASVRYIGV